ncbi:MAG: TIGR04283 family arsenosugar biosynthesis glycosyltransferase [Pirellulaceae bacterium]|jgi:rSAM/selenodomain-associated transferase 2|nr:TIGR04283 family arsenosugar biosynthesis glycosyltransferase [Pirellulaceae bacterium]|tara:strand:+ start:7789 stop:8490 length:702 start_codon:yes stop_codon:yes gene_type:complete
MVFSAADIAVIIPAINEQDNIVGAVESALDAGAVEVWVADGGSTDSTIEFACQAGALVCCGDAGRAVQQNNAAKQATNAILCFLHADNRLDSLALQQAASYFSEGETNSWSCFYQNIEAPGIGYSLLQWGNAWRARWCRRVYGDQAITIRRELFEVVGGFPEVDLMEDVLLSKMLRRQGKRPCVLTGPVNISARRWIKKGIIRQTLSNWWLLLRLRLGTKPNQLAKLYRRHDE